MNAPHRVLPVLVLLGLLTAGCTGPGPAGPASATPSGAVRSSVPAAPGGTPTGSPPAGVTVVSCGHIIDWLDAPPAGWTVLADAVAVQPGVTQPQTTGGSDPARLFAKTGLVVRADATAELTVPARSAGRPWIGWGSPAVPTRSVWLPGCPEYAGWVVFAGGYWLDEPACVPLTVRSDGRDERVRMRIGIDCPD